MSLRQRGRYSLPIGYVAALRNSRRAAALRTDDAGQFSRRFPKSMAGTTPAATAPASARKPTGRFCQGPVRRAIPRTENGELHRVAFARAFRAANLLLLVQDNLLEMRLAILTNVFINWHFRPRSDRFHRFYRRGLSR